MHQTVLPPIDVVEPAARAVRMTDAMRSGLDALEQEYKTFVEEGSVSIVSDQEPVRR